jgi:hypothetical protein
LGLPRRELPLARDDRGRLTVWCPLRRRWLVCTPEEEVRQQLVRHLVDDCGFPPFNLAAERQIAFGSLRKRFDLVAYGPTGQPLLLAECKAPTEALDAEVWFQAYVYNATLAAPWLLLTNGPDLLLAPAGQADAAQDWVPPWSVLRAVQ